MSSSALALVIVGSSATGIIWIFAVITSPPSPESLLPVEAWMLKVPVIIESASGLKVRPAAPCSKVIKSPL